MSASEEQHVHPLIITTENLDEDTVYMNNADKFDNTKENEIDYDNEVEIDEGAFDLMTPSEGSATSRGKWTEAEDEILRNAVKVIKIYFL